jgi:LuxR family maltose regulon positive regulatory protein
MNRVLALCHLGELCEFQARLRQANAYFEEALTLARDAEERREPVAGLALIGLGRLALERRDLQAAEHYLVEGIALIRQWGEAGAINGYTALARLRHLQGDRAGAEAAMQTAQQIAQLFEAMQLDDLAVAMQQAQLWVWQGDGQAAGCWAEGRRFVEDRPESQIESDIGEAESPLLRTQEYVVLASLRLAQGQTRAALSVLRPVTGVAERAGWGALVIRCLTLQSLAQHARGDYSAAAPLLQRALALAEPEEFVSLFVDEGLPMARLLYATAETGLAPHYLGKLLAAFAGRDGPPTRPRPEMEVLEPLSERELEVLQLIAAGCTNDEVAHQLSLSLNTVKWHVSNIFGKLGAKNRIQALARARAIGLPLEPACVPPGYA